MKAVGIAKEHVLFLHIIITIIVCVVTIIVKPNERRQGSFFPFLLTPLSVVISVLIAVPSQS